MSEPTPPPPGKTCLGLRCSLKGEPTVFRPDLNEWVCAECSAGIDRARVRLRERHIAIAEACKNPDCVRRLALPAERACDRCWPHLRNKAEGAQA